MQRLLDDLDPLVLAALSGLREQPGRTEQVDALVGEPRARVVVERLLPALGAQPHLLRQLAPRRLKRLLAVDVEPARGQLEQPRLADRLARLAHEPDLLLVVRDDRDRAAA